MSSTVSLNALKEPGHGETIRKSFKLRSKLLRLALRAIYQDLTFLLSYFSLLILQFAHRLSKTVIQGSGCS